MPSCKRSGLFKVFEDDDRKPLSSLCMQVEYRKALLLLRQRGKVWVSKSGREVTGFTCGRGTGGLGSKTGLWMSGAANRTDRGQEGRGPAGG